MTKATKRTAAGMEQSSVSRLSDDNVTDILLRLPAKSVLRAGAVCKAWRRFTTNPSFLAAHARLQPAEVVLYKYMDAGPFEIALDVVPVYSDDEAAAAARRRRLILYPRMRPFLLLASCDGVLLFQWSEGSFVLCNPTTRQWAELPHSLLGSPMAAASATTKYAFYSHQPSGEYRLLYCRGHSWFILSTGAAEPRQVDVPPGTWITNSLTTPVDVDGQLHWPPRQATEAGTSKTTSTTMVVFDTLSETFGQMAGPPTATPSLVKLFDTEGLLAAADFGEEKHVDLWFLDLEDYTAGRWEHRHRVATAWQPAGLNRGPPRQARDLVCVTAAADGEGNVMLGSHVWLAVYNLRTKTIMDSVTPLEKNVVVSRHVFKESLVRHPNFAARSAADLELEFSWC